MAEQIAKNGHSVGDGVLHEEFIGKAFQFKKMIATDVEGEIEWVKTFNRDQMKNNNKRWYGLIKITKGDVDMKEIIFHPVQILF